MSSILFWKWKFAMIIIVAISQVVFAHILKIIVECKISRNYESLPFKKIYRLTFWEVSLVKHPLSLDQLSLCNSSLSNTSQFSSLLHGSPCWKQNCHFTSKLSVYKFLPLQCILVQDFLVLLLPRRKFVELLIKSCLRFLSFQLFRWWSRLESHQSKPKLQKFAFWSRGFLRYTFMNSSKFICATKFVNIWQIINHQILHKQKSIKQFLYQSLLERAFPEQFDWYSLYLNIIFTPHIICIKYIQYNYIVGYHVLDLIVLTSTDRRI